MALKLTGALAAMAGWAIARAAPPAPGAHAAPAAAAETPAAKGPLAAVHAHVCGFHFYSGDLRRAVRADHYCAHVEPGVLQCVIYDSDRSDARLIGIEYIISEALFQGLPADEKRLWHSHRYEVMSGLLTAPDASPAAERVVMKELVGTYGKTWHFWQVDRGDKLPLGLPQLMMGFTADGQIDPGMVAARDRERGTDTARVQAARRDLPTRPIAPGADAWQAGPALQLRAAPPPPARAAAKP